MGLSSYGSKNVVTQPSVTLPVLHNHPKAKLRNQIATEHLKEIAPEIKKAFEKARVRNQLRNRKEYMKEYRNRLVRCPECGREFKPVGRVKV